MIYCFTMIAAYILRYNGINIPTLCMIALWLVCLGGLLYKAYKWSEKQDSKRKASAAAERFGNALKDALNKAKNKTE